MKLSLLLALTLLPASSGLAQDRKPKPTSHPFLERTFKVDLAPEQKRGLGDDAPLERLGSILRPDQKADIRLKLDAARANASTPEALKEIAEGYLLLDERGPEGGQKVVAIGARLRELEPKKPDGYTITADGDYRLGDYPAAAKQARRAWELSNHTDKRALTILKMSEGRSASTAAPGGSPGAAAGFAPADFMIPQNHDISPRAMSFVQQAITARREGDLSKSQSLIQAAMNADPTSTAVQKLYTTARADQARHAQTEDYLRRSAEALSAGRGPEAEIWAQKALERSGDNPSVAKILDLTRQRSAELARAESKNAPQPAKVPDGTPLWPLGAGLALAAVGYGVSRSRQTWASEDGQNPQPEASPDQARRNYINSAILIGTPIVAAILVYGGPLAWRTAAPLVAVIGRNGSAPVQNSTISSEVENLALRTGASNPETQALTKTAPFVIQELQAASTNGERIRHLLMPGGRLLGEDGSSSKVRILQGTTQDAEVLFSKLTQGAKVSAHPGNSALGKLAYLPNGDYVGLRYISKSGPPTIDINIPGIGINEIKFLPP
jgi:hypothetical protein